jgi:TolB-like protein
VQPLSLFKELKRRNVFRVGFAYTIATWLFAQIAELAASSFGAPDWVMKMIITMLVLGFPVALVMAWAYELTPDGLRRESDAEAGQSTGKANSGKMDRAITIVLLLAVAYFSYDKFVIDRGRDAAEINTAAQVPQEQVEPRRSSSVAVLPFVNLSNDPEQGFLSDGIADEIIGLLSQVDGMRVTARSSAFLFRDRTQDIKEIGRALGVAHILDGSVRRSGSQLRITAQLVDVDTGFGIWTKSFNREFGDVFTIQSAVAMEVLQAVKGAGLTSSVEAQPVSIDIYEDYLRARSLLHEESAETVDQARQLLETLVVKAPDDPRVHAALAQAIILDSDQHYVFAMADVRLDEVMELLARFEKRWPGNPVIDISKAHIAFRRGKLDVGHANILNYCEKVGYEFGVCVSEQINVFFQLELYDELSAISLRAVQPPLLDAFLCPVKALLPLTAMAAFRSEDYVVATDLWMRSFEGNQQDRDKILGASYAVAAKDWVTVREILEPETSRNIRGSLIQLHPAHERFALADLAVARRAEGDEQGALAMIDELKAFRETLATYHERRLFPTRTLHVMDMAIAATEGRGDDALEAYAGAYNEGFRFRGPVGEPLRAPWSEKPRFFELQAAYDADIATMRRNVREQLANHDKEPAREST